MKQVKLKIPIGKADAFATYTFNNNVRILITYSTDDFFDGKLIAIVAVPETFAEDFAKGDFSSYIQK